MILWNQVAIVENAMFTAPAAARVLDVPVTDEDIPRQIFYCFHQKRISQQLLSSSAVVHKETGAPCDAAMCTHCTGNNEKYPGDSPSFRTESLGPICAAASSRQQQSFASFRESARRYTRLV